MIVGCPSCATRYRVEPAALGEGGRRVRCARCGHVWRAEAPADSPAPAAPGAAPAPAPERADAVGEAAPPAGDRHPAPLPMPSRRRDGRIDWRAGGVAVAVVAVAAAGLVAARDEIAGAWPPTARLYEAVGLAADAEEEGRGLLIRDVASKRVLEGGVPILLVRGAIENPTGRRRAVPAIRAALKGETGAELQRWTITAPATALDAGQSTTFEGRLARPPRGAIGLSLRFAAAGPG